MSSLFHREESQEGEEGPVDPPRPTRERSHSKTKKTRRERRHADRGAESTAVLQPEAEEEPQTQVQPGVANNRIQCDPGQGREAGFSSPLSCRFWSPWRALQRSRAQSQQQAVSLQGPPGSAAPSFETVGRCTTTRRCPKAGPENSNRGSPGARPGSSTST